MNHRPIVLASGSQYRKQLLQQLRLDFSSAAADIDESPKPGEDPKTLVLRLSLAKASALKNRYPNHLIIGSDQTAFCNDRQLSKPGNKANCIAQLKACSGNSIDFYTGLCVMDSSQDSYYEALDITTVYFKNLGEQQIARYVEQEQPLDCAGGFKVEGLGIALFERIDSQDPNALIGLPLIKLTELLDRFGVEVL